MPPCASRAKPDVVRIASLRGVMMKIMCAMIIPSGGIVPYETDGSYLKRCFSLFLPRKRRMNRRRRNHKRPVPWKARRCHGFGAVPDGVICRFREGERPENRRALVLVKYSYSSLTRPLTTHIWPEPILSLFYEVHIEHEKSLKTGRCHF